MRRRSVMTMLGTVPELIRLSACLRAFDRYFDHTLVHTGQEKFHRHFRSFFDDMSVRVPDRFLGVTHHDMDRMTARLLSASWDALAEVRPDALVLLGGGIAAMAAVSARQLGIPVFHLQAGIRGTPVTPLEDACRRTVEANSAYHLAYTESHRANLLAAGVPSDRIFVTGSPMREALMRYREHLSSNTMLRRLGRMPGDYILLSSFRDTYGLNMTRVRDQVTLAGRMASEFNCHVLYATGPDIWSALDDSGITLPDGVQILHAFSYFDLIRLHRDAWCVLSDSLTLPEEVSVIHFPAVLLRTRRERMDALDKGAVQLGGATIGDTLRAVRLARAMWDNGELSALHPDYYDVNVSVKVVGILDACGEAASGNEEDPA